LSLGKILPAMEYILLFSFADPLLIDFFYAG